MRVIDPSLSFVCKNANWPVARFVIDLLLDEFLQIIGSRFRSIDIAHGIRRHAFRHGLFVRLRSSARNQGLHRPVFSTADSDAPFESGIALRVRLGIGDINSVVSINEDPARTAELLPLREKFAFLVEDLDAAVAAVADIYPPWGIDRNSVKFSELSWGRPFSSPRLDKLAVLRKFDDPRVGIAAMSIGHENIAALRSDNGRGPIECVLAVSCHARFSKGQQNLSIRTELDNLVAFAVFSVGVGHPHVAVADQRACHEETRTCPRRTTSLLCRTDQT